MRSIFLQLILLFLISCTRLEFVQEGRDLYKVGANSGSEKIIEVSGEAPFYFWGLVPEKSVVDFDKVFFEKGVHGPSMVKITRENTFYTNFITFLTLGLYCPEAYKISVYSQGIRDD